MPSAAKTRAEPPKPFPGSSAMVEAKKELTIAVKALVATAWRSRRAVLPKVRSGLMETATKSRPMSAPPAPAQARKKLANDAGTMRTPLPSAALPPALSPTPAPYQCTARRPDAGASRDCVFCTTKTRQFSSFSRLIAHWPPCTLGIYRSLHRQADLDAAVPLDGEPVVMVWDGATPRRGVCILTERG